MPEPAWRTWQEGERALDLRLLGDQPQAVRLGQGHLPEPIRDRGQLSTDEPMSDSDDDVAVCGAVLVRGDRVPDAEPMGMAPLCGPVEPPSRWSEVSPGSAPVADDAALAPGGGVHNVQARRDSIVRKNCARTTYVPAHLTN